MQPLVIQKDKDITKPPTVEYWDDYDGMKAALSERFEELVDYSTSCPDYPRLAKYNKHYLFVYDSKKHGFRHNKDLRDSTCIATGYTKSYFTMYHECRNGIYKSPIILMAATAAHRAPVYGEVYEVSPETIMELDWVESNGPVTQRVKVPIDAVVDKSGTVKQLYCWIYTHRLHYWNSRMERLQPCEPLIANSNKMKYFNFTKNSEQVFQ